MIPVHFFKEDIIFDLRSIRSAKQWLTNVAASHNHTIEELNYIFCSDKYLLNINQEYLQHDTYTDIITFDMSEDDNILQGDIFISIDRVKENALNLGISFQKELFRVMVHGMLHLIGYPDKTDKEKKEMRRQEDIAIALSK